MTKPVCGEVLYLYLAVSEIAVSAVLTSRQNLMEKPIYFLSKKLTDPETRYNKLEKNGLALLFSAQRLRPYFEAHTVTVVTNLPLKQVVSKIEKSGRLEKWGITLGQFDIHFERKKADKSQVYADFLADFPVEDSTWGTDVMVEAELSEADLPESGRIWTAVRGWKIFADGSSSSDGSAIGVVILTPDNTSLEIAEKLTFPASNNEAEYEAVLRGLQIAHSIQAKIVTVFTDSRLVVEQFSGGYKASNGRMIKYLGALKTMVLLFDHVEIQHLYRGENRHADALAYIAAKLDFDDRRQITVTRRDKSMLEQTGIFEVETLGASWMDPIILFLQSAALPEDKVEARKIKETSKRYELINNCLYRKSNGGPHLRCAHPIKARQIMEEVHNGTGGNHSGGRALAHKILSSGYFWPKMVSDCNEYSKVCLECQKHAKLIHAPAEELHYVSNPWPFAMWGLDVVGKLPKSGRSKVFLLVATDYFTKWVEAIPLQHVKEDQVISFIWENIVCRFGLPKAIVSDNGAQFRGGRVQEWLEKYKIKHYFSTPNYPQGNGQAEATNKVILDTLKKKLEDRTDQWVHELNGVLWAYRTTKRRSTGESPFSMAYGMEAVIPPEMVLPTTRSILSLSENEEVIRKDLVLAEEKREAARIRLEQYHRHLQKLFTKKVHPRRFKEGELVLRRVYPTPSKLKPNWEGPFVIRQVGVNGAYFLQEQGGLPVAKPWNVSNLKKYHVC